MLDRFQFVMSSNVYNDAFIGPGFGVQLPKRTTFYLLHRYNSSGFLHTKCEKCEHHLLYMTSILQYTFYLFTCIIFASTWHTVQVTRQFLNKRFKSSSSLWCADGKYFQFIAYFLYFVPNIQSLTGKKMYTYLGQQNKAPPPKVSKF